MQLGLGFRLGRGSGSGSGGASAARQGIVAPVVVGDATVTAPTAAVAEGIVAVPRVANAGAEVTASASAQGLTAPTIVGTASSGSIVSTNEGGIVYWDNVTGAVTYTLDGTDYTEDVDGTPLHTDNLANGPQCPAGLPATWDETGAQGVGIDEPYTRGVWLFDAAQGEPTVKRDILSGVDVRLDDRPYGDGVTGGIYTPELADAGTDLTIVETATQGANARSATSAVLSIPAASESAFADGDGVIQVTARGFVTDTTAFGDGDGVIQVTAR